MSEGKDTISATDIRLQALANGYIPLPNRDKRCFLKKWPTVKPDERTVRLWGRRDQRWPATGLRVENGLCVIDLDINHPVIDKIIAAIEPMMPEGYLLRRGKGLKEAWFLRCDEMFPRIHTRSWVAPGQSADDGTHVIEAFGGATARQFGAFGPHTMDDDTDEVKITYEWDGPSPLDVPLADLPSIPKSLIFKMLERAEEVLEAEGFTFVVRSTLGENDAVRVYDLTDDMVFDLNDGSDAVPLAELTRRAKTGETLRCSASWLERGASNRERCLVTVTRYGQLAIWESAAGTTHMPVSAKPLDLSDAIDRASEALRQLADKRRYKLTAADEGQADVAAAKIMETYAFCPARQKAIVPLWADDPDAGLTVTAFRQMMQPYAATIEGPRGGSKKVSPVDLWMCSASRVLVEGLRMRPDQPRPIYEEDGRTYINVYAPPLHDEEGGEVSGGLELLAQLLPDPDERHWFTQWLAYKMREPFVPGPAVIMVAANTFGTGRGTLARLLERLFGSRYTRSIPFHIFAGQSYQSQYNDWLVSSVVVFVNESSNTEGSQSTYRTKTNTYEHLKETVDPRARSVHVVRKGENAFDANTYASFIIATNNRDALPLPPDDRRFAVLTNGQPRDVAFWDRVNKWMESDANIAAFARWLGEYDLAGYSPYDPPIMTEAKRTMIELGGTDIDRAFSEALGDMVGEVVCAEQVIERMKTLKVERGYEYVDGWQPIVKRLAQNRLTRIGERGGAFWLVPYNGQQVHAYVVSPSLASFWSSATPAEVLEEMKRNEAAGDVVSTVFNKLKG